MSAIVRAATESDVPAIADILNEAIVNTLATWMHHPFSLEDRYEWFSIRHAQDFPILVADVDGVVAGYSTFGPFRAYDGYARTVEHSVYIHKHFRRRGLGRALMLPLIETGRARGDHVMVGAIGLPNEASVALHTELGFVEVGRMPEVGWKFDAWRDLLLMQKIL
ncbi:MAG: N-acetyltransferase family protein [Beijerinckiaceae bacterium]